MEIPISQNFVPFYLWLYISSGWLLFEGGFRCGLARWWGASKVRGTLDGKRYFRRFRRISRKLSFPSFVEENFALRVLQKRMREMRGSKPACHALILSLTSQRCSVRSTFVKLGKLESSESIWPVKTK